MGAGIAQSVSVVTRLRFW